MEYRYLGRTGLKISRLAMGTMTFGGDADEAASRALFERCREAGINFFDCADVYAGGRAEEILGRLIAGCRREIVLSSKGAFPTGSRSATSGAPSSASSRCTTSSSGRPRSRSSPWPRPRAWA